MTRRDAGAGGIADGRRELWGVLLLVVAFCAFFLTLCVQKWRAYGYGDFDLPIFDQAVWRTSQLEGFLPSSIRFGSVFADHVPLILVGIVPLYWLLDWLVPGALILLALQVLAVGSAAIPLHLLARRVAGPWVGVGVATAFLLHPATGYLVLFEFHPGVLAVPFVCWMLWAEEARRWRAFLLFAALAMACREDVALVVGGTATWALWRRARRDRTWRRWDTLRWGAVPAAAAVAWFALAVFVIVPAAQPQGHPSAVSPFVWLYTQHVPAGGATRAFDVILALLGSPVDAVARSAAQKPVAEFTWQLVAPTAGLALLSPLALLPALPSWFLDVTSSKLETTSICYQYTSAILPFLFLATAHGIARAGRLGALRARPWLVPAVLAAAALVANGAWGKVLHPHTDPLAGKSQLYVTDYERDVTDQARDALVALVPRAASLVATFGFLHRAPSRSEVYSWHYVRSGVDPVTGGSVTTPEARYALLDAADRLAFGSFGGVGSGERQRAYLAGCRVVARAGPAVLLVRQPVGRPLTVLARREEVTGPPAAALDAARGGSGLFAVRHDLVLAREDADADGHALPYTVTAAWAASRDLLELAARETDGFRRHGTLWARVVLLGDGGRRLDTRFALSYGLHPISEWAGFDPERPDAPCSVVTATYPVRVPPGTWSVRLEADHSPDPRPDPLFSADLGEVHVP